MNENRHLCYMMAIIFGCALFLVVAVIAHDRGCDQAIVDHLFHFHIDEHAVREKLDRMRHEKDINDRTTQEWVNDLRWKDSSDYGPDVGTVGPPDRDK